MATPEPDFDDALDAVRDVGGWMSPDQARALWDEARRVREGGRIVEIGSFQGRSAIVLARAAQEGVEVVAIDPHGGTDRGPQEWTGHDAAAEADFVTFHANLDAAGVTGRVRHVRRYSDAALGEVEGPVDFLYIDGAHRWRPCRSDIVHWGGKVPVGGAMYIHDAFSSKGVTLALVTQLFGRRDWHYEGRSRSLARYRRVDHQSWPATIRDLVRQAAELPWFVRNLLIKGLITLRLGRLTRFLGQAEPEWPY